MKWFDRNIAIVSDHFMKCSYSSIFTIFCFASIFVCIATSIKGWSGQSLGSLQPIDAQDIQNPKTLLETDTESLLQHESNGPEGLQGMPMQRATLGQIGSAVTVLLLVGGLAFCERPNGRYKSN